MEPARWEQINRLFHAAIECGPDERAAFLGQACAGDEGLRREVESLLASHDEAASFIEAPAADLAEDFLVEKQARLSAGQTVGHYEIEALLGRGGMGEVYLAIDTTLARCVALKILPASVSQEADRIRRFQQEARVVSALNHPNIVTIFETGEAQGLSFIATEYVEGETLRSRLRRQGLTIPQVLDLAIQVAEALASAHQAGIAHRDIKPENIMVRPDGYVKVVDFSLAKLNDRPAALPLPGTQTSSSISTVPGLILGTAQYMSPEQARGQKVDARSDIFSLGVVVYEAVTGRLPFAGETTSDLIANLLKEEPPPLRTLRPDAPLELQHIVGKALRKDRRERYQHITEFFQDLQDLKRDVEAQSRPGEPLPSASTDHSLTQRLKASGNSFVVQVKRYKAMAAACALLLLGGIGLQLYRTAAPRALKPLLALANLKFTKLTSTGDAIWTISPDGQFVVYETSEDGGGALEMRQLATGETARRAHFPASIRLWGVTISPDSHFVYCWVSEVANPDASYIERIPLSPGPSQRVIARVKSRVTFSPDGQRLAFSRWLSPQEDSIILADSSGDHEQVLTRLPRQTAIIRDVAWSPDNRLIAAAGEFQNGDETYYGLIGVRFEDAAEVPLSQQRWSYMRNLVWLPDGSGIIISAVDHIGNPEQLWEVAYPTGVALRLTPELLTFAGVSITADGSKLLTSQADRPSDIWLVPNGQSSRAMKLTTNTAGYGWLDWTPDGRIVYELSSPSGTSIWVMDADGSNKKQLTFPLGGNVCPVVTPDGQAIVFVSRRTGADNLWRMDCDGGNEKQLTFGNRDRWPVAVPGSQWILYKFEQPHRQAIMRVSLAGGPPKQIAEGQLGSLLAASPDGRRLAYDYYDEANKKMVTAIRPLDGGAVEKTLDIEGFYKLHWSADGQSLISNRDGHNLWQFPINGGPAQQITHFPDLPAAEMIIHFAYRRDGKYLVATRGKWSSDVVMIHLQ
ncbi:MAG TPA: protein kinase [Blastocatellia bacterium]|nr:protein kinase [Blastocatellia bacterium]